MAYNYEYPYDNPSQANSDWLLSEMKRLTIEWAEVQKDWTTQQEAFESLRNFITNYFDNLDVQEEINTKIEDMVESGELSKLIAPYIIQQANPVFVDSISQMVDHSKTYVLSTNGHVYTFNGSSFTDTQYIYSMPDDIISGFATQVTVPSILSDANDALANKVYCIAYDGMENLPTPSVGGTLLTYNYVTDNRGGLVQLFITRNANLYYRIKWGGQGGTWSDWVFASMADGVETVMRGTKELIYGTQQLSDFNSAIPNRIYTITTNQSIPNAPESAPLSGTLITFNYTDEVRGGLVQFYINISQDIYYRIAWGSVSNLTFFPWEMLSHAKHPTPTVSMFTKWGAIGDSFISGVCGTYGQFYQLSWVQNLARREGVKCLDFSRGGLTTESWLTAEEGKAKLESSDDCNFYIIALGINDSGTITPVALGAESDLSSDNPPNTFYGNMKRIHDTITAKSPNSIICFVTIPRSGSRYEPYNTAIKTISQHYNSLLLDSAKIPLFTTTWWNNNLVDAHPTAVMYSAMATAYGEELSKVLEENAELLKTYTME